MVDIMSTLDIKITSNLGYRSWFASYTNKERGEFLIFILDYETDSKDDETNHLDDNTLESPDYENEYRRRSKRVNGVQVYFLDENHEKHKAFLRHDPYFYLLLRDDLSKYEIGNIITQVQNIGGYRVTKIENQLSYDAADLTFLRKKFFLKITVNHPGSVPELRKNCEEILGVVEWREADVLFHHRTAIDHQLHVGYWYKAQIRNCEIQNLELIPNKAPPDLKILAFDIETVFEQTRDPNPEKDSITMISLFTGYKNLLIINSEEVEAKDMQDMEILIRKNDDEHSKPWIDWIYLDSLKSPKDIIERHTVKVYISRNEKELLQIFYKFLIDYKPDVIADFFGSQFDIPFLAYRSQRHGFSWEKETGFIIKYKGSKSKHLETTEQRYSPGSIDHVKGGGVIHLDAYLFNEKYSYLPKKDLGLKPSVEKKLKIIPIGREALFAIKDDPVNAAAYASCDGLITWKYVREIVLDFFISIGQMFPVPSSEILTRRAGSLDDLLIDAEGFINNIVSKRRIEKESIDNFSSNINVKSLAYTGGLVEAKRPGIWRSDLFYKYNPNKKALDDLKELLPQIIRNESENYLKKIIKEEFDKRVLQDLGTRIELDGIDLSTNSPYILHEVEREFLRNGISSDALKGSLSLVSNILEDLSKFQIFGENETINDVIDKLNKISELKDETQLKGIHVDVTSMYPSQIRQYKLQPSAIIPLSRCGRCEHYESDKSCFIEKDWVVKLTALRPCRHKQVSSGPCDPSKCRNQDEVKCKKYEPLLNGITRSQEIFTNDGVTTEAYKIKRNKIRKVPLNKTYLGSIMTKDPYSVLQKWIRDSIEGAQIIATLDQNHFDIFDDLPASITLPQKIFMSVDVRKKNITVLLSVYSRVCQKSYNFVARIMDEFFEKRVRHKVEAKRLYSIITHRNTLNQEVPAELIRQQKFHDSTQLGMKVPLNSIYGLLGMKAGVRNASTPCAGITTKLSADLIHWAAEELEKIGLVTELDTDGIWLWIPKDFPHDFPVSVSYPSGGKKEILNMEINLIDSILNSKVKCVSQNDNYWINDGKTIKRTSNSLIGFEQDGPYDFQFVMGKKKYIVYNYDKDNKSWEEKELTGLESKRADFSELQKYFQEEIIRAYLENYNPDSPLSLSQLYQEANKVSDRIHSEITNGEIDISYLVKPKAINKSLTDYKSKLPQVDAAKILIDLGFSVDLGTRVQMLNIKGNRVIPKQVFDFDFSTIKRILMNHDIARLSFEIDSFKTVADVKSLIDVNQYIKEIFGPSRIFDRMIKYPMEIQQAIIEEQKELEFSDLDYVESSFEIETEVSNDSIISQEENLIIEESKIRESTPHQIKVDKKSQKSKKSGIKHVGLDQMLGINILEKNDMKQEASMIEELELSSSEISELESENLFTKGVNLLRIDKESNQPSDDFKMFCSECGTLININDLLPTGCPFCGERKI